MIGEKRDCESIVTQLMAARAALDRASLLVISYHLERCLIDDSGKTDLAQLDRIIEFLLRFSTTAPESAPADCEDDAPAAD